MDRLNDLRRFYSLLSVQEVKLGGKRTLSACDGRMGWPQRGVYFFFEPGEFRSQSGEGPRLVRVGTHALNTGSRTTLWNRLSQHQGSIKSGGGNHRGSIFRLHVGTALAKRDAWPAAVAGQWGSKRSYSLGARQAELPLEQAVSLYIRSMPFLWLAVEDEPGPKSLCGVIERNSIALLSNFNTPDVPLDPPSPNWLGRWADRELVRRSGLWNVNHVAEVYDPAFLDLMEGLVEQK